MKKVLFVATVVKTHIMEFHVPYLEMFKEMGWETAVASRNDYENPVDCVIPHCDKYYNIPFERSPLKLKNITAYKQLKRIIDEQAYDIIHCHTPVGAMIARLAAIGARKKGTKVIYTAHGFHFFKGAPLMNWLIYYPVEWALAHITDVLITINKEDYARAQKFKAKKVCYVPGVGIDFERLNNVRPNAREALRNELGIPQGATVVLSVGEVNENKNHRTVIKAIAQIDRKDIWYVICGRGPLMEEHKRLADELGIGNRVILTGYRTDVAEFYRIADVFAFPSFREGLGLAALEAMAVGLPIITSNVQGINDYSENGMTGYKCNPQNVEEFAMGIQKMLENSERCKQYALYNKNVAMMYDYMSIREKIRLIYEQVQ